MATLISVNVGMPKDVQWRGRTVHTGIWKVPVDGPVMVRRLNIDGDGQGDLAGHGGEQRAVMVYQAESYEYWARYLARGDLTPGNFGENFTVEGLSDDEVCIGDRYRIGDAEFEVTQPRVTCYRVGMRLGVPEMPNLLVSHHRPGFYFRVIAEGLVQAGDAIERTRRGRTGLSVADVDALLYLPDRNSDHLRAIVEEPALSPGWQSSFCDLLADADAADTQANAAGVDAPAWQGFRPLRVTAVHRESPDVSSIEMENLDRTALPPALPGQYIALRIADAGAPAPLRSYSLSGDPTADRYRISVKREERGQLSSWLHSHVQVGSIVDVSAPRGDFILVEGDGPIALLSAGIGITPVLAMLHALAASRTDREVWWLHTTRSNETRSFAAEVDGLIDSLPHARARTFHTATGERLDAQSIASLGLPAQTAVYLCGPVAFMNDMRSALVTAGIDPTAIHSELFGSLPAIQPGVVDAPPKRPHPPSVAGTGPQMTFARSGLTVKWSAHYGSILELAEACDVPARYSCRSGVCHTCETEILAGATTYVQAPLEEPRKGTTLICCAVPQEDLVVDL